MELPDFQYICAGLFLAILVHVRKRLLLVDDDEGLLDAFSDLFRSSGWEVQTAVDGESGMARVEEGAPDVVLTDLMMPGLDGFGLMRRVSVKHPDVPVVVLTGYPTADRFHEALRCGATDFVTKPGNPADILRILDQAVEYHRTLKASGGIGARCRHVARVTVPADIALSATVEERVRVAAESFGFGGWNPSIRTAIHEAFRNAVNHGCGSNPLKVVDVMIGNDEGRLVVRISDPGSGVPWRDQGATTDGVSAQHRGVTLMRATADELRWIGRGNICEMVFRSNPRTPEGE